MAKEKGLSKKFIALVIGLGVLGFLWMVSTSIRQETLVRIDGNTVFFFSVYGSAIPAGDIKEVELVESIPKIGLRVRGARLGRYLKGDYQVEGWGTCRLYLHDTKGPFLVVTSAQRRIILNFRDPAKTQAVYEEIKGFVEEYRS
ncbi:MAG: hypothetical protein GX205_04975 [Firmicutes bacterium]|jgi:hypothetical protein|nr:hypothetical protein [Bacillota bacterium]